MKDKVVIITGAASGIGLATSRYFLEKGSSVIMADINAKALKLKIAELAEKGYAPMPVVMDVSREEDCKRLVETTVENFSRLDVLISNAGMSMRSLFHKSDMKVFKKLMDVNFWGTTYCSYYAIPYLLKTKGSLLGVTSVAGRHGLPGRSAYSSSKFAIHGLFETIRIENMRRGLHVCTFAPGYTATGIRKPALEGNGNEQGKSPRDEKHMATPEFVASKIYSAVLHRKRDVVLSWEGKGTIFFKRFFMHGFVDRMYLKQLLKEPGSSF